MNAIDQTIMANERLHEVLTGARPPASDPEAPYAPIPPERDPVAHVEEQIDRLLEALARPAAPVATTAAAPTMAIFETDAEYVVFVDVPGVRRERLDVHLRGNMLVVVGRRENPKAEGLRARVSERPTGPFHRAIRLPPDVRATEMNARLDEGVLEIRIPRSTGGSSRSVPVA
jgi:HSP20 family molecular chaperone IbpA